MRKLLARYRKRFLLPVTFVLTILGLINFYFVFEVTPQPNDECLWIPHSVSKDSVAFLFDEVKFEGVTWNAGIRDGDELLEINDKKITDLHIATMILYEVESGDSAKYKIGRNGSTFETKVEIKKLIQFSGLATALLSFIWLMVGFVVLTARPQGFTQILFYRIGATLILLASFNLLIGQNVVNPVLQIPWLSIAVDTLWSFGGIFGPFLLIHFFWIFPRSFKIIERKYTTKILYFTPLIMFILITLNKALFVYTGKINPVMFYTIFIGTVNCMFGIGLLIGIISLFINYLRLKTKQERNSIFVILISYAIGVAAAVYTAIIVSVGNVIIFNQPEFYMPIILIAILPVSFGYSIFRYSLMDVSDVIKNAIMYGAATITIAGTYFAIIYFLGQSISTALGTDYQGVVAGAIFIVFAIVFQSTKDRFQNVITRKFYPEQFAYQKVLVTFSNDVSTIVGLENILDSTHKTIVESLKLNKFGIALKDEVSGVFELKRQKGIKSEIIVFPNDENIIQKNIDEKKSLKQSIAFEKIEFEKAFPEANQILIDEEIYTIIPLVIKSKVIGLLLFGLKYSGAQFAGKDIDLLIAAANQTAVSIENARLYESEAMKLKIERDLENARIIQQSLLPSSIPQVEGLDIYGTMIPAMQVGGDYFDIRKVSDNKLFVVIGDVSGKGLSASLYMSKMQTMVELYCTETCSPRNVLIDINKRIFESIEKNWFITVSIALFDLESKTVKICRAGHTPTLLVTKDKITSHQSQGIGVGLESGELFNDTIEEVEFTLNSGDLFVFYSDGINEAMNEDNELFGMEKFETILLNKISYPAKAIADSVINSLNEFRGKAAPNDDITFVAVKIQ